MKTNIKWFVGLLVFIGLAIVYNVIYFGKVGHWNRDYIIISTIMIIVYCLGGFIKK